MSNIQKVNDCIFCGEPVEFFQDHEKHIYHIQCEACDAKGPTKTNALEAITSWNNAMNIPDNRYALDNRKHN